MKYRQLIFVITFVLILGFYFGRYYASENITTNYECNQIARFHADLLVRNYDIEFNTSQENPNRGINQRASDLNLALLRICMTSPE